VAQKQSFCSVTHSTSVTNDVEAKKVFKCYFQKKFLFWVSFIFREIKFFGNKINKVKKWSANCGIGKGLRESILSFHFGSYQIDNEGLSLPFFHLLNLWDNSNNINNSSNSKEIWEREIKQSFYVWKYRLDL